MLEELLHAFLQSVRLDFFRGFAGLPGLTWTFTIRWMFVPSPFSVCSQRQQSYKNWNTDKFTWSRVYGQNFPIQNAKRNTRLESLPLSLTAWTNLRLEHSHRWTLLCWKNTTCCPLPLNIAKSRFIICKSKPTLSCTNHQLPQVTSAVLVERNQQHSEPASTHLLNVVPPWC